MPTPPRFAAYDLSDVIEAQSPSTTKATAARYDLSDIMEPARPASPKRRLPSALPVPALTDVPGGMQVPFNLNTPEDIGLARMPRLPDGATMRPRAVPVPDTRGVMERAADIDPAVYDQATGQYVGGEHPLITLGRTTLQGIQQVGKAAGEATRAGVVIRGGPLPVSSYRDQKLAMASFSDLAEGTMKAATPAVAFGLVTKLPETLVALGTFGLAQYGTGKAAQAAGLDPETARFIENFAGTVAAAGGLKFVLGQMRSGVRTAASVARAAGDRAVAAREAARIIQPEASDIAVRPERQQLPAEAVIAGRAEGLQTASPAAPLPAPAATVQPVDVQTVPTLAAVLKQPSASGDPMTAVVEAVAGAQGVTAEEIRTRLAEQEAAAVREAVANRPPVTEPPLGTPKPGEAPIPPAPEGIEYDLADVVDTPAPASQASTPATASIPAAEKPMSVTPDRRLNVGRGANGQVVVHFPDAAHKTLFEYAAKVRAGLRSGNPDPNESARRAYLARALGVASDDVLRIASRYREAVIAASKPLEDGATLQARTWKETAEPAAPVAPPGTGTAYDLTDVVETSAQPRLTYEQFAQQYRQAFAESNKYTPGQVGSRTFTDKMAKLSDDYPAFMERFDAEEEKVAKPKAEAETPAAPAAPPVAGLPDYAAQAVFSASAERRTNEGGSIDSPDPFAGGKWVQRDVPIADITANPRNKNLGTPQFGYRGSVTKGPIVIDDRGEVIDGNNRVHEAIGRGETTIRAYVFQPPTPAASGSPSVVEPPASAPPAPANPTATALKDAAAALTKAAEALEGKTEASGEKTAALKLIADTTWLHGTFNEEAPTSFDPKRLGTNTKAASAKEGVFLTDNEETAFNYTTADDFTENVLDEKDLAPYRHVLRVTPTVTNPAVIDAKGSDLQGWDEGEFAGRLRTLKAAGHDAALVKNVVDGGPASNVLVVFDPARASIVAPLTEPDAAAALTKAAEALEGKTEEKAAGAASPKAPEVTDLSKPSPFAGDADYRQMQRMTVEELKAGIERIEKNPAKSQREFDQDQRDLAMARDALARKDAPAEPQRMNEPPLAEAQAGPQKPINPARLLEMAAADEKQWERSWEALQGADMAEGPFYHMRAKMFRRMAEGQSVEEAIAQLDTEWRKYAAENNAKVNAAPKLKRGPSSGHSSISFRWVSPDKAQTTAPFIRSIARQAETVPPTTEPTAAAALASVPVATSTVAAQPQQPPSVQAPPPEAAEVRSGALAKPVVPAATQASADLPEPPPMPWSGPAAGSAAFTKLLAEAEDLQKQADLAYNAMETQRAVRDKAGYGTKARQAAAEKHEKLANQYQTISAKASTAGKGAHEMRLQERLADPKTPREVKIAIVDKLAELRHQKSPMGGGVYALLRDASEAALVKYGATPEEAKQHAADIALNIVQFPLGDKEAFASALPRTMLRIQEKREAAESAAQLQALEEQYGVSSGTWQRKLREAYDQPRREQVLQEAEAEFKADKAKRDADARAAKAKREQDDRERVEVARDLAAKGTLIWRRMGATGDTYWVPADGKRVTVPGVPKGYTFSVFREKGHGWRVIEDSTGYSVGGPSKTQAEAAQEASENIKKNGLDRFKAAVESGRKDAPPKPDISAPVAIPEPPAGYGRPAYKAKQTSQTGSHRWSIVNDRGEPVQIPRIFTDIKGETFESSAAYFGTKREAEDALASFYRRGGSFNLQRGGSSGGAQAGIGTFANTGQGTAGTVNLTGQPAQAPPSAVAQGAAQTIRPIEFPELVDLARDLISTPKVVKAFRKEGKVGEFNAGAIRLASSLFKKGQEHQLAAALAHEIGHAIDWLPDYVLKRGNLLGRLRTLRSFLKHTFTDQATGAVITLSDVRAELLALSSAWRPWDPEQSSASFASYRQSSVELFADAISVLLNDPGRLERDAPIFFREFFAGLDEKPDVKRAYFDMQALLSGTKEELIARRREGVRGMAEEGGAKALDIQRRKIAEAEERKRNVWFRLKTEMVDRNYRVIDAVVALEKRGIRLNPDEDPRYALEEMNYLGGILKGFTERTFAPIYKAVTEAGITWTDFHEGLFYERIIAGDRSETANPRGISIQQAVEQLAALKDSLGGAKENVLNQQMNKFRQVIRDVAEEAFKEGLYTPELYAQMQKNPAYVTFRVLEHLEDAVTSTVYRQIGTLKDIDNVADQSMLKVLATKRAIARNHMVRSVVTFFEQHGVSGDIQPATTRWNGKTHTPVEPKDRRLKLITFKKDGHLVGRYVDAYIAGSINKDTIGQNLAGLTLLRQLNAGFFRPVFTTLNLGFQSFNVLRDLLRTWTNVPGLTLPRLLTRYAQAAPMARARAFGSGTQRAVSDLIEAEESGILSVTLNDLIAGREVEDTQVEDILARMGVGNFATPKTSTWLRPFAAVFNRIRELGDFVETLPKAAMVYEWKGDGDISSIPADKRSFIRRKVGSPDFLAGGTVKPITNEVFLFSNAITQALRSDLEVATDPATRAGFWWKVTKLNLIPKLLMLAAMGGVFGEALKRLMEKATEYDRTNYIVIPLGEDGHGQAIYLRLPQNDVGRVVSGLMWKALRLGTGDADAIKTLAQVADYSVGVFPSVTPTLELAQQTLQFVAGQNPYDSFRGRNVFTDDEWKARDATTVKKFLGWEFQQLGGGIIWKFVPGGARPAVRSNIQKVVELPVIGNVVGRFVRVSGYGEVERLKETQQVVERDEARRRLRERAAVNEALRPLADAPAAQRTQGKAIEVAGKIAARLYPSQAERKERYPTLLRKVRMGMARSQADPVTDAVLGATSNDQKVQIILTASRTMRPGEVEAWLNAAVQAKVISASVALDVRRSAVRR